jgi:hypothetical protein
MTLNVDLIGQKFGQLTVTEKIGLVNGRTLWRLVCACGQVVERETGALRRKRRPPQSCGCRRHIGALGRRWKHGHSKRARTPPTPTYMAWTSMKARCEKPTHVSWATYGGRGITVCERWQDFSNFLADMGERPDGLSLDRIDVNGNYEPGNCRWATDREQNTNRRTVMLVDGISLKHYAELHGIPYSSLNNAVKRRGEDPREAVERLKLSGRPAARGPRNGGAGRASPQM